MNNTLRFSIRCALAAAMCASAGVAAAEDASSAATLEEVIVTAQKRSERIIDVPVSITAVSSEALTQENLVSISDFFSRIPDLQYNGKSTYALSLRGVTTGGATNPTLSLLIDDVQFGSSLLNGLGNSRFPDIDPSLLDHIEVLRGPQGTLYGASSIGGAIKYVTRQPDTTKLSGRVEVGGAAVTGGSTEWNARGSINLPFWSEKAALSVSGFTRRDPAWVNNVKAGFEGKDVNKTHTYGGRAALLLKPVDGLSITLTALRQKRDADFSPSIISNIRADRVPTFEPAYGENNISLSTTTDVGDQQLYTGRVEWDVGGINLTSITSYGKSDGTNVQDLSTIFFFIPLFYGLGPNSGAVVNINDVAHTKKFAEELRVSGKAGPIDWRGGVYYTKEDGGVDQRLDLFDASGAKLATPYDGLGPFTYKEKAVFADATWHLTPKWDLQAGVRYAKNDQTSGGGLTTVDGPIQPVFGPTNVSPILPSNDHSFTYEFSPIYHFNEDLMAYARVASGYRPGGPNTVLPGVPASYKPDKVVSYELGMKGFVADKKISFDLAAFQINWTDIQLQDTDAASQFVYSTNGGKARSRGVEGAVEFRPGSGWTIAANATFLDAKLTQTLPALAGADTLIGADGNRLPGSPTFSANASVQRDFRISDSLTGSVAANVSHVGSRISEFVNTGAVLPNGNIAPRFEMPSYTQIDLRGGVATASNWRADLYVRNLTNKDGVVTATNRNGTNPSPSVVFLQPRTYGITLSKSF
jgi:iron complex outermembrane recepter protein